MISTLEELEQVPVGTDVDVFNGEEWRTWVRSELGLALDGADLGLGRFSGTVGQDWVRLTAERPPEPGDYLRNRMYRDHYHALYVVREHDDDQLMVLVLTNGNVTGTGRVDKTGVLPASYERFPGLPDDLPNQPDWADTVRYLADFHAGQIAQVERAHEVRKQYLHRWAEEARPAPPPSFDRALERAGIPRDRTHVVTIDIGGTYRSETLLAFVDDADLHEDGHVAWTKTVTVERTASHHQHEIAREEVEPHVPELLRVDWSYSTRCCAE